MQTQARKKRYVDTNQKGGATKSTKVLNASIAGAQIGKRVLTVDWDHAQGNVTYALGYAPANIQHTGYTVMQGESTLDEAIRPTYYDPKSGIFFDPHDAQKMNKLRLSSLEDAVRGPDLLPMNPNQCDGAEHVLVQRGNWGLLFSQMLDEAEDQYDEFHIDTNPDINNIFPKLAVYGATDIVIPSTPENWSLQGMIMLAQFLMRARTVNERFQIAGVLFSRIRYAAHREAMKMTQEEVIPAVNTLFQETRDGYRQGKKLRAAQQLEGLHLQCFTHTVGESKEYSIQTNIRSTVMTSKKKVKGEYVAAMEEWQCYIELLQRTGGLGIETAINHYNTLVEQYEQAHI